MPNILTSLPTVALLMMVLVLGGGCVERTAADLIAAIEVGDEEGLKAALEAGVSPNGADERGRTPLQVAIVLGRREACLLLLAHGADQQGARALATKLKRPAIAALFEDEEKPAQGERRLSPSR